MQTGHLRPLPPPRPSPRVTSVDTETAARVLGCGRSTARAVLARIAARTGRSGRAETTAAGGRPARTVPLADFAAHLGLSPRDVIDAAALAA